MYYNPNKVIYKKDSWSELRKLEISDLNSCLQLQETMSKNMGIDAYDFTKKRTKAEFEEMIKKQNIYGIFNNITKKLIALVNFFNITKNEVIEKINYKDNLNQAPDFIKNIFQDEKYGYFACFMTDLETPKQGLGTYLLSELVKVLIKSKIRVLFGEIHVKNIGCYKCVSKNAFSFTFAHRIMKYKNMANKEIDSTMFHIISILDKKLLNNFISNIKKLNNEIVVYNKDTISKILNTKTHKDNILNDDEILILENNSLQKYKIKSIN